MAVAGLAIIAVAAADSLVTWSSNTIWISPTSLEHAMAFVLIPAWIWLLLGSAILYSGHGKRLQLRRIGRGPTAALAALALFCLTVVVGGFVIGGDKGSLRVLPGPRYQVFTPGLNDAEWTTVTAMQYRVWEARFLREDGLFTLFGLFMVVGAAAITGTRRQVRESTDDGVARRAM